MLTAMDIVVLLLIGGGAVLGVLRGFVMEVLSLFAWVAAIFALKLLHGPVATLLLHVVHSPSGAAVLAFVQNDFVTGACLPVDGGRTVYAGG